MREVGFYGFGDINNSDLFYLNEKENNMVFYSDSDLETATIQDTDLLENWAVTLNSPWSQVHEHYRIEANCKDAYTEMDENEPTCRCRYHVIGYEGIEAEVIGYGNTEEEALADCKKLFKYLQDNFNKDDVSF